MCGWLLHLATVLLSAVPSSDRVIGDQVDVESEFDCLFSQSATSGDFSGQQKLATMPSTTAATHRHYVPIEDVRLGSRVSTSNPKWWEYDDSLPEPDQSSWLQVEMIAHRSDGGVVEITLLRPRDLVESMGIKIGTILPFEVDELQVTGTAQVTRISPALPISEGDGHAVTGRYVTRRVDQIARLEMRDEIGNTAILEGTPIHPIWSVDRQDWVPLGELESGERLQGADGLVTVLSLNIQTRSVRVYNLEIHGEHVYEVGEFGILVHNSGPSCELGKALTDGVDWAAKAMRALGYEAGHMVPWGAFSRRTRPGVQAALKFAKDALTAADIGLNESWNGFWTNSARHLGTHTDDYFIELGERLKGLTNRDDVLNALALLRDDILDGKFL